jgi:hypothetical protein
MQDEDSVGGSIYWSVQDGLLQMLNSFSLQVSLCSVGRRHTAPPLKFLYEQTIQTKSLIFLLASGGQCQKGSRTVFKQQLTALALGSFLADVGSRAPTTLQGEVSIGTPSHLAQLLVHSLMAKSTHR